MSGISKIAAGGTRYTTVCQGGGDKKAGLVPTATGFYLSQPFAWRAALGGLATTSGNGRGRGHLSPFYISTVNQIGGVGKYRSQTTYPSDGVNVKAIKTASDNCKMGLTNSFLSYRNVKVPNIIGATKV
tara:strand:- start:173 stop:559 length:387 start_codon:yes stop_codon:yes gene_type:complete